MGELLEVSKQCNVKLWSLLSLIKPIEPRSTSLYTYQYRPSKEDSCASVESVPFLTTSDLIGAYLNIIQVNLRQSWPSVEP